MLLDEILRVAFQSIRANKLRSMLTMLGIIIGVGAVITMVALGTGAQKAIEERINALGANLLTIFPGQSFQRGVASGNRVSLTVDDAEALERDARQLSAVVPEMQSSLQLKYGNKNLNVNVVGTTPNYATVRNYTVTNGRMFSAGDNEARQRYAVLGASVPGMMEMNPAALIGQTVSLRGIPFEIIGVLGEKGSQGSWNNPDEQILIPLQTARFRVFGSDRIRSLSVQVADGVPLEQGMVDIERVLRREHKIRPGGENDFQIRNQQEILATQQAATQVFTILLASIAGVSLMVGGIGIMNIMLVSVTERTREIGIRKAIGATRRSILLQFLFESSAICLLGGSIGIVLAAVVTAILNATLMPASLSLPILGIAVLVSVLVGLAAGVAPAYRGARLDPIEALRYE
jgi:putative ABC transport system permease protein